jgi:hypothetical protein
VSGVFIVGKGYGGGRDFGSGIELIKGLKEAVADVSKITGGNTTLDAVDRY